MPKPRVHKKMTSAHGDKVKAGESLLSEQDVKTIQEIEAFIAKHQAVAVRIFEEEKRISDANQEAIARIEFLGRRKAALEDLRLDILDNPSRLAEFLETKPFADLDTPGYANDLTLREILGIEKGDNVDKVIEKIGEQIRNEEQMIAAANKKTYTLDDEGSALNADREALQGEFSKFKKENKYVFDVDPKGNLTKISKKGEGPTFSVIYGRDQNKYILYTGKEFMLGSGGFGNVKLVQDVQTGTLFAVKIQERQTPEALEREISNLESLERLQDVISRDEAHKHYIVMHLVYGEDLKKTIATADDITCEKMLLMAAIELQKLHDENKIHTDIKLENFMWDDELSDCALIDLASVTKVEGDEPVDDPTVVGTIVGTEEYLAPEANGDVPKFSKRSDIYAFGIMLGKIIEQHPHLNEKLQSYCKQFITADFDARALNLNELIKFLKTDSLKAQATSEVKSVKERAAEIDASMKAKTAKAKKQVAATDRPEAKKWEKVEGEWKPKKERP